MAEFDRGSPGFLVLDKPSGITSHGCVARVRRAYGIRRVGHGGTLDPAVTGVLPIALGPATRLIPYLPGEKTYRATVTLGVRTTTDDLEGDVLERRPLPPRLDRPLLEEALQPFRGTIAQRPPDFSAVHVEGQRAYALAREGRTMVLPERTVTLHRLSLLGWDPLQGTLELEIHCSAGTYIRALARDLGENLGCGATLACLRRTAALGFYLDQSMALETLVHPLPVPLDPMLALGHLSRHALSSADLTGWRCGRAQQTDQPFPCGETVLVVAPDGKLAGLARMQASGLLQPCVVFDASG